MKISTKTGLVGFLLALSTLSAPVTKAQGNSTPENAPPATVEARLAALTEALKYRENQLPEASKTGSGEIAQIGWRNGGWRDRGGAGWRNGGGFANWPNSWRDGGGFVNWRKW